MNIKILIVSGAATLGLLTFGIQSSLTQNAVKPAVERMTTVDVQEPAASSMFSTAPIAPVHREAGSSEAVETEAVGTLGKVDVGSGGMAANAGPRIAYRFGFGFRLAANQIKPLQERHADMCETRGPQVCRIISMEQAESDDGRATGMLQLAVAAPVARSFGKALTRSAQGAEAELVSSSIDGEDLSKRIIDTEARLRARTLLRDRLMDVLRNRRGTVAELVEAERGVAQVNEEIDQATSLLADMRARVTFSALNIDYTAGNVISTRPGFTAPIGEAFADAGGTLGTIIGGLVRMLTFFAPFILLGWLAVFGWRRLGRPGAKWVRSEEPAVSEAAS